MRTKTLLLAAAATVAGIASLQAQSNVYSVNVVGYVNVTIPTGYSLIANPLNSSDNTVSNLFNATSQSGAALGSTVYTWNGAGFIGNNNDEFGGGWPPTAPFTVDNVKGPQVGVAQSFFYKNIAGTATWVRNFTIP